MTTPPDGSSHRPRSTKRPLSLRGAKIGAGAAVLVAALLTGIVGYLHGRVVPLFLLGMLVLLTPLCAFLGAILDGAWRRGDDSGEEP